MGIPVEPLLVGAEVGAALWMPEGLPAQKGSEPPGLHGMSQTSGCVPERRPGLA